MAEDKYREEIEQWRARREASLRGEYSWLSLQGLFWLREGDNTLGSDSTCDVELPAGSTASLVGHIRWQGGAGTLSVEPGVIAEVDGRAIQEIRLLPDTSDHPTRVQLGRLRMVLIERGSRFGIRVWDPESPARRAFTGCRWFAIDAHYRYRAQYLAYDPPRPTRVANILGDTTESSMPGRINFALDGQQHRLEVSSVDEDGLFVMFSDETSTSATYPSGRYLVIRGQQDGSWDLDFNRAYNPPCAFTPFATCELPPQENRLPLQVLAGERYDSTSSAGRPQHHSAS